jgi:alpha-N-arabinofuranosidase
VRDKNLTMTVVNPSTSESRLAEIAFRGATVKEAAIRWMSDPDIHAHNTFEHRDALVPQTKPLSMNDGALVVEFPPACVAAVNVQLN